MTKLVKVVPFMSAHGEDLLKIQTGEGASDRLRIEKNWVQNVAIPDHSYSMISNGHLIAAGGIFPIWTSTGEAWLIPSDRVSRVKKSFAYSVRHVFGLLVEENSYRRVQASARADYRGGQRFLEWLGFEREGLMKSYGPDGADYVMYGKVMT